MKQTEEYDFDLVIVGAGVSGASQFYTSAKYTNIKKVALIEKEASAGSINSKPTNNSQTLHEGDIETNYDLQKATAVKYKSHFTRKYVERKNDNNIFLKGPKMVLGVGEKEYIFLAERYEEFKELYPTLERLEYNELEKHEPHMFVGRKKGEKIIGLYNKDGITVDYQLLSRSLILDTQEIYNNDLSRIGKVFFNTSVKQVTKKDNGYKIDIGGKSITTKFLSFCAGAHSLYFAKLMKVPAVESVTLSCIAGNFYYTPKYLNAKVYTVQNPNLPFSAVHGDPDILHTDKTRFGPTTRIVLTLERHKLKTFFEFIRTFCPVGGSIRATLRIIFNKNYFRYIVLHNILFPIPFLGNYLFVREARKIIPNLKYSELKRAKGQGGVRPQIVLTKNKNPLSFGEAKFSAPGVRFNITPSPGASTAIYNGLIDIKIIASEIGATFNQFQVEQDFEKKLY